MITTQHKIKERVKLLKEAEGDMSLRIIRITDGFFFSPSAGNFEEYDAIDGAYVISMSDFSAETPGLKTAVLLTLPDEAQDLLFEFTDTVAGVTYERHVFGGVEFVDAPLTCLVHGTLIDVTGKAMVGQKVEVFLNRAGYFSHKAGLIGYAATALTDESGYFEIPLIRGIDVTVNVPVTGFSARGYVPNAVDVELSSQSLLSYQPVI